MAVNFRPHDVITLANRALENTAVLNVQLTPMILDAAHLLEHSGRNRDTCAPRADSGGDHLLSQSEVAGANAIVEHQQPTTESLKDGVPRIANTALSCLRN